MTARKRSTKAGRKRAPQVTSSRRGNVEEDEPSYETRLARKIAAQIKPVGKFTLGELALDWLKRTRRVSIDNERRHVAHLGPLLQMRDGEMKKRDVEHRFFVLSETLSASYLNSIRSTASLIIRDAQANEQWYGPDPFALMKRRKLPRRSYAAPVTYAQMCRVIGLMPPHRIAEGRVMLHLGPRPGELKGALKADVDLEAGTWLIRRSNGRAQTKTGSERLVPIPDALMPIFVNQMQTPGPYLFPTPSGARQSEQTKLSKLLRAAAVRAEVPENVRLTWYGLRHMAATFLRQAGCEQMVIRTILGHAHASVTEDFYTHLSVEFMRSELNKLRQ